MEEIYQSSEVVLRYIVEFSTLLLELFGICILVFSAVKSFVFWIRRDDSIRLQLAQGHGLGQLEDTVAERRLAVVNVRDDAKVADVVEGLFHAADSIAYF